MATQYIDKDYGANSSTAIANDTTGQRKVQSLPDAAGIKYDLVDNQIKFNGNGTVKALLDTSSVQTLANKTIAVNAAAITAVGTNQTTAFPVVTAPIAVLTVTGATDTGLNLPAATAGQIYIMKKLTTDVINIYSTGADTLNGVAGSTAVPIAAIGALAFCVTAGAWRILNVAS